MDELNPQEPFSGPDGDNEVEILDDEPEALQEPEERPGDRMLLRYERMGGFPRGRVVA